MLERFAQHVTGGTDTAPEVVLVLAGTNDVCDEVWGDWGWKSI